MAVIAQSTFESTNVSGTGESKGCQCKIAEEKKVYMSNIDTIDMTGAIDEPDHPWTGHECPLHGKDCPLASGVNIIPAIAAYVRDLLCILWSIVSFIAMITLKTFVGLIVTVVILLACNQRLGIPLGPMIIQTIEKALEF